MRTSLYLFRVFLIFSGVVSMTFRVYSQQNNELVDYLAHHEEAITQSPDGMLNMADPAFLLNSMHNKSLFVFGEGGSHFLQLHGKIRLFLAAQFSNKIKYFFMEGARSSASIANLLMNNQYDLPMPAYSNPIYIEERRKLGAMFNFRPPFSFIAIDFERPQSFYVCIKYIEEGIETDTGLHRILTQFEDTSYLALPINTDNKAAKIFFRYYRHCQEVLERNKSFLSTHMSKNKYDVLVYLLSNPNTSGPGENRNRPMVDNLLSEIKPIDSQHIYLLDCGISHSRPNVKGSLVNILSKDPALENKIVVMNVYCDNCKTVEDINNDGLPFITGDVLAAFQKAAASNETVLYDLSQLPGQYEDMKKYGDFILFARNQH